jgi:transcriptional regulator with XRE-family HTH domain
MGTVESPAVARRRLRLALRKAREAKGFTQGEVAKRLEWSLSKVNRIESGEVTISNTDLQAVLRLFDITDTDRIAQLSADARASRRRGWWDEPSYREHLTPATMQMLQFETEATAIRVFQPVLVPGLLQTRPYSEFIMNFFNEDLDAETRRIRLDVRVQRHGQVFETADPPAYFLMLDESVLFREMGGPEIMADQLRQLLLHIAKPHISLRVLPMTDAVTLTMLGQFTLFDLGDEENAVLYHESIIQDEIVHNQKLIRFHREHFDQKWDDQALDEEASARLIEARAAEMRSSLDRRRRANYP